MFQTAHAQRANDNYQQGSKNIFIKMLKDVGMIVPKRRETSAVYMQQDRR